MKVRQRVLIPWKGQHYEGLSRVRCGPAALRRNHLNPGRGFTGTRAVRCGPWEETGWPSGWGGEDRGRKAAGAWLLLLSGRKAGDLQREMAGALPKSVYDSMRWLWTPRQNFISGHRHMTYWLQNLLSSGVTTQRST